MHMKPTKPRIILGRREYADACSFLTTHNYHSNFINVYRSMCGICTQTCLSVCVDDTEECGATGKRRRRRRTRSHYCMHSNLCLSSVNLCRAHHMYDYTLRCVHASAPCLHINRTQHTYTHAHKDRHTHTCRITD